MGPALFALTANATRWGWAPNAASSSLASASPSRSRSGWHRRAPEHARGGLRSQADLAVAIDAEDLHLDLVALLEDVLDALDAMWASSEMCSRPSMFGRISTKAPKSTMRLTVPL
jgi:hypothetical protein